MEQILLDSKKSQSLYMQIYQYFKNEIVRGHFKKGEKLPSIRALSMDLNISKTTVEAAYNQLAVEGYIHNLPKRGYFVVELKDYSFPMNQEIPKPPGEAPKIRYKNLGVDKDSFDIKTWKKCYSHILLACRQELFTGGDPQGEGALREEILQFVQKTRGVKCTKEQIVIGAGVQYLLGILCSLLKNHHNNMAIEYPGFNQAKHIFEDYSMEITPIPVDGEGIRMEALKNSKAKMVYLSPSHQYPTGSVMPIDKRIEILNWAEKNDSIIIEDDYDCLIRYETQPIPALQGLDDGGRVIYLGSFSKILLPSVRISYMILPDDILEDYRGNKKRYSQSASKIEQLTLAEFMNQGYLEKHLRKIKKIYYKKKDRIVKTIERYAGDQVKIIGHDSGLHMMFKVKTEKTNEEILRRVQERNIFLEILDDHGRKHKRIVFTYSGLREEEIREVLNDLMEAIL